MTTCQIAFGFKNRVVCIQEFSLDTPNVFQKMKASASQYTGGDATDIVLETMSAGSHVTIRSDQDAAKYIFGCAVDGRAKIKVKIARKPKKEHSKELEFKSDSVMEMPASKLVNQSFIRKMIELLDQWAEVEISYEEAYALVEALKAAVLERDPLESLIDELVRALGMEELNLFDIREELDRTNSTGLRQIIKDELSGTIPTQLFNRYDSWITMASQEELLYVAEQVPTVLDKLVSRRGKLFEDVFIKQKPLKKILKIRLPKKSKNQGRRAHQKEGPRTQHLRKGETHAFDDFEEVQPLRQPSPKRDEIRVPLKVKKETFEVESSSVGDKTQKHQVSQVRRMEKAETKAAEEFEEVKAVKKESKRAKKEDSDDSSSEEEHEKRKREVKLAKRLERAGCKTAEELEVLKTNKELKHAQALQKYGCLTRDELKQARKEERLARQLARTGCQDEEELSKLKLAKKLERAGCKTVEELNELKKQRKFSKPKRDF